MMMKWRARLECVHIRFFVQVSVYQSVVFSFRSRSICCWCIFLCGVQRFLLLWAVPLSYSSYRGHQSCAVSSCGTQNYRYYFHTHYFSLSDISWTKRTPCVSDPSVSPSIPAKRLSGATYYGPHHLLHPAGPPSWRPAPTSLLLLHLSDDIKGVKGMVYRHDPAEATKGPRETRRGTRWKDVKWGNTVQLCLAWTHMLSILFACMQSARTSLNRMNNQIDQRGAEWSQHEQQHMSHTFAWMTWFSARQQHWPQLRPLQTINTSVCPLNRGVGLAVKKAGAVKPQGGKPTLH